MPFADTLFLPIPLSEWQNVQASLEPTVKYDLSHEPTLAELSPVQSQNLLWLDVTFYLKQHLVFHKSKAPKADIEQGPNGQQKVWLDLATSGREFTFALRPANGAEDASRVQRQPGFDFGGMEATPKL
jgi:hypothetical protein